LTPPPPKKIDRRAATAGQNYSAHALAGQAGIKPKKPLAGRKNCG